MEIDFITFSLQFHSCGSAVHIKILYYRCSWYPLASISVFLCYVMRRYTLRVIFLKASDSLPLCTTWVPVSFNVYFDLSCHFLVAPTFLRPIIYCGYFVCAGSAVCRFSLFWKSLFFRLRLPAVHLVNGCPLWSFLKLRTFCRGYGRARFFHAVAETSFAVIAAYNSVAISFGVCLCVVLRTSWFTLVLVWCQAFGLPCTSARGYLSLAYYSLQFMSLLCHQHFLLNTFGGSPQEGTHAVWHGLLVTF